MVDPDLGLAIVFNGCIYNHHELRRELEAHGYRFFSTGDTEVILKAYRQWGDDFVDHLVGMFALLHRRARQRAASCSARDRLGIKPLYLAEVGGRAAVRVDVAGAAGRRRRRHLDRPRGPAPVPDVPLGGAGAAHDPRGGAQAAARHAARRRARRPARTRRPTGAPSSAAAPSTRAWSAARLGGRACSPRCAPPSSVAWWPTCPWACLLSGGLDSSLIVGLLAEAGVARPAHLQHRLRVARRHRGRRVPVLRRRRRARSPPTTTASASPASGCSRRSSGAIAAMSEPMVSHDVVAFYLLSRRGGEAREGRAVRPGGRRGLRRATTGTRRCSTRAPPSTAACSPTRSAFFDRPDEAMAEVVAPPHRCPDDAAGAFVSEPLRAARRRPRPSTGPCASTPRSCSSTTR